MRTTDDAWRPFSTLYGFVRLVLLIDWDPLGVLGYSGAMDEYDSYADDICRLIHTGAARDLLIAHLDKIEKQRMGLGGNDERKRKSPRNCWQFTKLFNKMSDGVPRSKTSPSPRPIR